MKLNSLFSPFFWLFIGWLFVILFTAGVFHFVVDRVDLP